MNYSKHYGGLLSRDFILTPANLYNYRMDNYKTYMCQICGWIYEEEKGVPEDHIEPGTRWQDLPMNWVCPECGARKEDFEMVEV